MGYFQGVIAEQLAYLGMEGNVGQKPLLSTRHFKEEEQQYKLQMRWIEKHTMDTPPQSPDLTIIKSVWDHRDREWNKRQSASKEELECRASYTRY